MTVWWIQFIEYINKWLPIFLTGYSTMRPTRIGLSPPPKWLVWRRVKNWNTPSFRNQQTPHLLEGTKLWTDESHCIQWESNPPPEENIISSHFWIFWGDLRISTFELFLYQPNSKGCEPPYEPPQTLTSRPWWKFVTTPLGSCSQSWTFYRGPNLGSWKNHRENGGGPGFP